jgi:hypothetical protein
MEKILSKISNTRGSTEILFGCSCVLIVAEKRIIYVISNMKQEGAQRGDVSSRLTAPWPFVDAVAKDDSLSKLWLLLGWGAQQVVFVQA